MQILIDGNPKEIAALVLELQGRQDALKSATRAVHRTGNSVNPIKFTINRHDILKNIIEEARDKHGEDS